MSNFNTELEILQDENFAIKAPKGFKGEDWKSKSGRTGRILYSRYSPDYISSDCYITVSTIAHDPITAEVRRRIENSIGQDGFSYEFAELNDKHTVFYAHEEEVEYHSYHAFILLSDVKSILVDVVFNTPYDDAKEVAYKIISSLRANFKAEVTPEELAEDEARLEAESQQEAAKEAAKQAQMQEQRQADAASVSDADVAVQTPVAEEEQVLDGLVEEEDAAVVSSQETKFSDDQAPVFDDSDDGKKMQIIFINMNQHDKMTINDLQMVPELREVARMEITRLLNQMIRDKVLVRFENADNIYFALPGHEQPAEEEKPEAEDDISDMDRYKIEYEQYKIALAEWKKSRDFFGRTSLPKPVEPVKPKKR